ncbi:MFS transporter [Microbacterium aoyamense]|uniref:MFS transporter n=1 Tax=Microbacterium aoyamense TaxID=344166 RepID=A0ABP5BCT3_9MICO|nr:MFS transporter [Microbacterium aoyamense]
MTGSILASLDLFVIIVAFGSIGKTYPEVSFHGILWGAVIYPIVSAALVLPAGALASRWGEKSTYIAGLIAFVIGSAVCGLAPELWVLSLGRAAQGVGAGFLLPTSLALLQQGQLPERQARIRAGWAVAGAVAAAAGPLLGGLVAPIDWRLIFLVNIVLAAPALVLAHRLAPTPRAVVPRPDVIQPLLIAAMTASGVIALSNVGVAGASLVIVGAAVGAVLSFGLIVLRSARSKRPAIEAALFRVRSFALGVPAMLIFYAGFAVMLVSTSRALSGALDLPPPVVGLLFAIGPAAAVLSGVVLGRRLGPASLAVVSGALFVGGGLWWSFFFTGGFPLLVGFVPGMILLGLGAGNAQAGILNQALVDVPAPQRGAAAGTLTTARQVGTAFGIGAFVAVGSETGISALPNLTWAWLTLVVAGLAALSTGLIPGGSAPSISRVAQSAPIASFPEKS